MRSESIPSPIPEFSNRPDYASRLDRSSILHHLDIISSLDKNGLSNTLAPHRELPIYDPASYIISHNGATETYSLGVVFARSLVKTTLPEDYSLPVISEFDETKKQLVDNYLRYSERISAEYLIRNGSILHADIYKAIDLFAKRCEVIVPALMLDGSEQLMRGCHDYLSVLALLESHQSTESRVMRSALGKLSLRHQIGAAFDHIGHRRRYV